MGLVADPAAVEGIPLLRSQPLDIDPDRVLAAHRDERDLTGMAEVEIESPCRQPRLAVLADLQLDSLRLFPQIGRENPAQGVGRRGQTPDVELAQRGIEAVGGREELQVRRF